MAGEFFIHNNNAGRVIGRCALTRNRAMLRKNVKCLVCAKQWTHQINASFDQQFVWHDVVIFGLCLSVQYSIYGETKYKFVEWSVSVQVF